MARNPLINMFKFSIQPMGKVYPCAFMKGIYQKAFNPSNCMRNDTNANIQSIIFVTINLLD